MNLISFGYTWVITNYIPFIILYVAGGLIYALLKWFLQVFRLRNAIKNIRDTEPKAIRLARERIASYYFTEYEYPPRVKNNKGALFLWAVFWPVNLVYTMFADVARSVWEWVYATFGTILQKVTNTLLPN